PVAQGRLEASRPGGEEGGVSSAATERGVGAVADGAGQARAGDDGAAVPRRASAAGRGPEGAAGPVRTAASGGPGCRRGGLVRERRRGARRAGACPGGRAGGGRQLTGTAQPRGATAREGTLQLHAGDQLRQPGGQAMTR